MILNLCILLSVSYHCLSEPFTSESTDQKHKTNGAVEVTDSLSFYTTSTTTRSKSVTSDSIADKVTETLAVGDDTAVSMVTSLGITDTGQSELSTLEGVPSHSIQNVGNTTLDVEVTPGSLSTYSGTIISAENKSNSIGTEDSTLSAVSDYNSTTEMTTSDTLTLSGNTCIS